MNKTSVTRIQKQKTLPIPNENDTKKKRITEYESLKRLQRNQVNFYFYLKGIQLFNILKYYYLRFMH